MLSNLVDSARRLDRSIRPNAPTTDPARPPVLSGAKPLIGHTLEFVNNPLELLRRANREQGEIAEIRVANKHMVAMFGPDAHEAVFRAPDTVLDPRDAYALMTPIFGDGLVYDAPVDKMGEQLKMLLPALKDRRMRTYGEAIVLEVERSVADWGDGGQVDLVEYCRTLTNYTSSRCLVGREFREDMTDEFASIYHDLERGITPIAYLQPNLPLPAFIQRDRARVKLVELISRITDKRRRTGETGEDFLQTLMEAHYSDGRALTDDEITGMLLAAIFAGHHTSSVTTAWALLELLRNQRFMRRTVEEIDRVFADGGPVDMARLRQLHFTEWVVKETLRLHPPLFMLVRVTQEDWTFKQYMLPKGTWIIVSPTVSHEDPAVFQRPLDFDPDRFGPPREEGKNPWGYVPFGGGRHKCLGNAFAILQIKTILAILLRRFEFDLSGDAIEDDFMSMVIGPKGPCRVRYRLRDHADAPATATTETKAADTDTAPPPGCPAHAAPTEGKALRVKVDHDLCQGHAVCAGEAPEIFEVDEHDKVRVKLPLVPAELTAKARAAEQLCPNRVISLEATDA